MADLLEQGAAFLDDQRHKHMSRAVVYQRGAESKEVSATIGRTEFEQADEAGLPDPDGGPGPRLGPHAPTGR